jgi:hypothetical protein
VRKSGSSERVAYGPKPRENALSRVLSAPHSPDDFGRMDDGAVGINPLNGAFPGVQVTHHRSLSHPPIRCHHTPRATKRLGRPFLSDCAASATAGRTPYFGGGAVWGGGSSRNLFRDHAGQLLPAVHTGLPSNRGPTVLACRAAHLPYRLPSTQTSLPHRPCRAGEREGLWGFMRLADGSRGPSEPPLLLPSKQVELPKRGVS